MSDSLQPHGLWPTRLLCPWDSPGKKEYWSGLPFPPLGHLLSPEVEPTSPATPALQANSLPLALRIFSSSATYTHTYTHTHTHTHTHAHTHAHTHTPSIIGRQAESKDSSPQTSCLLPVLRAPALTPLPEPAPRPVLPRSLCQAVSAVRLERLPSAELAQVSSWSASCPIWPF